MRVIGIITARGGSKGVPRKNLALLAGRSLLSYTASAALGATKLSRVILTTDDSEIAHEGERCGIEVPFMRPVELARDDTPTLPVLQHAVHYLEANGDRLDAICLLQPTHPFRTAEEIDACIERLEQTDADAVMTVSLIPHEYNPHWAYWMNTDGALHLSTGETNPIPRRQALPPAYHREGSVYVTRRDVLVNQNTLYGNRVIGYPVDKAHRINIDTLDDFHRAELEMQRRQLKDA